MIAVPEFPLIQGFGGIYPLAEAGERPDPVQPYKVLFSISKPAPAPGQLNPGLDRVPRFLNLLAHAGVTVAAGHVVVIVHDAATPLVLNDLAHRGKLGIGNPNALLLEQLHAHGVQLRVCSQALAAHAIDADKLHPAIRIDVAAIVTLPNLQARGFALIPL